MKQSRRLKRLSSLRKLLAAKEYKVAHRKLLISKNTRRMLQYTFRTKMALQRIESLKRAIKAAEENIVTSDYVHQLLVAKRLPGQRVRNVWELGNKKNPTLSYVSFARPYTAAPEYTLLGTKSGIVDYKPILQLYPPRNITYAQRLRVYGLRIAFKCEHSACTFQSPKWYYASKGLKLRAIADVVSTPIVFSQSHADKALLAAFAKIYEADLQTNEYILEWKQTLRLLRDPLRTVLRAHRLLERWTRRDAWIFLPSRTVRKFGKGLVRSKASTGAVLMSMRTRKTMDIAKVSDKVLGEACNRWLQYRYGIAPLASDIAVAMNLWRDPSGFKTPLRSHSARFWVQRPQKYVSEVSGKQVPMDVLYRLTETTGHFYSAKVWYRVVGEPPVAYRAGMHPKQFLNIIWNALPWSFVADWVVNVDRWLTGTMTADWIRPIANVVTAKDFTRVTCKILSAKSTIFPYPECSIQFEPHAVKSMERMNRKIDLPRPTLPQVSDAWQSAKNAMTSFALIYQPFMKRYRNAN